MRQLSERAMQTERSYIDWARRRLADRGGDAHIRQFAARPTLMRDPADRVVGAMATFAQTAEVGQPLPVLGG
jgi:hypothetical protein